MKKMLLATWPLLAVACGPAPEPVMEEASSEAAASTEEADVAAIRASAEEFDRTNNTEDLEGLMATYADDAVRMPPNEPAWVGKAAIRAGFQADFEENDVQVENQVEEVQVSGDWAFARGTYAVTITPSEGGEPVEDNGKWMAIFQRQADGSWKDVRDMWSSDNPPMPEP